MIWRVMTVLAGAALPFAAPPAMTALAPKSGATVAAATLPVALTGGATAAPPAVSPPDTAPMKDQKSAAGHHQADPGPMPAAPAGDAAFAEAVAAYRAGDPGRAARLFSTLSDAGDAEAQYNLSLLYLQGEGVPQNLRQALYWGWRSRLGGLGRARALIALIEARMGPDADPKLADPKHDEAMAAELIAALAPQVAAGSGHAMLGTAVVLTEVLPEPDLHKAHAWQSLAAAFATPGARKARDKTLAAVPPEEVWTLQAEAAALFAEWCSTATLTPLPANCDIAVSQATP